MEHFLARERRTKLLTISRQCRSDAEFYDFATIVFPPHQIRSEILRFLELARAFQPRTVLEIGTATGGTHYLLGTALPSVTLTLGLDLFVQRSRLLEAFGRPGCRQIFRHGDSRSHESFRWVRDSLAGLPLDVLFIDGDHTYAGVKGDFDTYTPLVRPGGIVALHDIVPDWRTRFGRETGRWAGDVPRFWRDIKGKFAETMEIVEDSDQDGLGIGVIHLPGAQRGDQ